MIQALAALLGAALTVAACYSAGALLVDGLGVKLRRSERLPLAFLLGAACLHLAVFAVLALRIAYWPVLDLSENKDVYWALTIFPMMLMRIF